MVYFFIVFVSVIVLVFVFAKPNISERKTRLMNLYSSVLSDMNMDYRDSTIGVQNIWDIGASIVHLSNEITKTSKGISGESGENQKWLVDLIGEFTRELDLWMHRHASELEIVTTNLADTLPESPTLDLMTAKLQTQISALNRARVHS
jgi:hypothetical protein